MKTVKSQMVGDGLGENGLCLSVMSLSCLLICLNNGSVTSGGGRQAGRRQQYYDMKNIGWNQEDN